MTVIERFATFACDFDPPKAARTAASNCLLDWFGAALAGSVEPPATFLRKAFPGTGTARLLPDGETRDPRTAALINATASHIVEVDDIYRSGLYHPGVVTIPAALALGDDRNISGDRLIRAIIAGYEVSNRIARAVNPSHYQHWHTTGTVGHFGAAVAACVAIDLNAGQTAHALATVTTFAAGLRHAFSSDGMSKPLHAGRAAEAGVTAALMAESGVTGVLDMLEGERGFGVAMSADVDWQDACASLGSEWTITLTTPKAHACCGHNFAALDAIQHLMRTHAIDASKVSTIEVASYRAAMDICGNPNPQTPAEARFSLPWCAAVMAQSDTVTPAAFSYDALDDQQTRALAARVSLKLDPEAEARFPGARSATVRMHLVDGKTVVHHRPTRKGDPDDPMTQADLSAKFHALSKPVIGDAQATALAREISLTEELSHLRTLPIGQA